MEGDVSRGAECREHQRSGRMGGYPRSSDLNSSLSVMAFELGNDMT